MACWLSNQAATAKAAPEVKERARAALKRLEAALASGAVKVVIDRQTGALAFAGQWDRDGVADTCAYRSLTAAHSSALRMAIARAEAMCGMRHSREAMAAGIHSHDGGQTFGPGH